MTPDMPAMTPLNELVARAIDKMASGSWRLLLEHPEPSQGASVCGFDVAKEIARRALAATTRDGTSAGLCPRCAGTGRDPSTTSLQCSKCMGQGAVVLRASLKAVPEVEVVAWQRFNETIGRWLDTQAEDVARYCKLGVKVRALVVATPQPSPDAEVKP